MSEAYKCETIILLSCPEAFHLNLPSRVLLMAKYRIPALCYSNISGPKFVTINRLDRFGRFRHIPLSFPYYIRPHRPPLPATPHLCDLRQSNRLFEMQLYYSSIIAFLKKSDLKILFELIFSFLHACVKLNMFHVDNICYMLLIVIN